MKLEFVENKVLNVDLGDVLISNSSDDVYIVVSDSDDNYLIASLDGGEYWGCYQDLNLLNENIKGLLEEGSFKHYSSLEYKLKLTKI